MERTVKLAILNDHVEPQRRAIIGLFNRFIYCMYAYTQVTNFPGAGFSSLKHLYFVQITWYKCIHISIIKKKTQRFT